MRALFLITSLVILPAPFVGQSKRAISAAGGFSSEVNGSLSLSYSHLILVKQLYVVGGVNALGITQSASVTDDVYNLHFGKVVQTFAGIRIGDYIFAFPKLTYNWYGRHNSVGWGFASGLLIPALQDISLGFAVAHDQIRFDSKLDRYGPTRITSLLAIINFHIVE